MTQSKSEEKNQEVGFYNRDNSPASSSKYQHNMNLFHCINLTYRAIHPLIRFVLSYQKSILWHSYGCIDSGPQFINFKSGLYRGHCMLLIQYQESCSKDFNDWIIMTPWSKRLFFGQFFTLSRNKNC